MPPPRAMPSAPLTTAISSREYIVSGVFNAALDGPSDLPKGVFEVGYQIGCGIELGQVRLIGQVGVSTAGQSIAGLVPTGINFPISGTIEIHAKPGTVSTVTVDKKDYKEIGRAHV